MLTKEKAFRASYCCLGLALLTIVGLPVGCSVTRKDNSGWDFLSDDINFLTVSAGLIVAFLFASLLTGVYARNQHRIVFVWIVPLVILFGAALVGSFWGLYIYMFDPYGTT